MFATIFVIVGLTIPPTPPPAVAETAAVVRFVTSGPVERWRPLVEEYFRPEYVDRALRVMRCESGGNTHAKNRTSTASGLFQALKGWWSGNWGYPPFDPYNPEANIRFAAWLSRQGATWQAWSCKP
jgi:soluble lytic murein transglycosylase-like protein